MTYIDILEQDKQDKLHAKMPDATDFEIYLAIVDFMMGKTVGVTHRDIADWAWYDAFEDEVPPKDAVLEALQSDDVYSSLFS